VVPEDALLPKSEGLKSVFECLNFARYGVACGAVGSAIACYQAARTLPVFPPSYKYAGQQLPVFGPAKNLL
jgi:hypothetical protein